MMWKEIMVVMMVIFLGKTEGSSVDNCIACSDIAFLIDESGSISNDEFTETKNFMKDVVQRFPNIGPTGAQFAAVKFSSLHDQTTEFDLNDHVDTTGVLNGIDAIVNNGSTTHIGAGLMYLASNIFNVVNGAGRPCAVDNRFAVVITDGQTSGNFGEEAAFLKSKNVKILAVGVGDGVATAVLQEIATTNDFVFQVGNFSAFSLIIDDLISKICTPGPGPHGFCGFPCTLHNKTYELCSCDVNNVNQSYSVGVNDTTLFTENFGGENKTDWECYTRSGRFYVVRRCIAHNVYEYRCMRDIMYNTTKDLRVYCMSEWAQFPGNPSLCDVCDGSAFDNNKALIIKEQSERKLDLL
ncbi:collagen alpha-6(VI) chain-like [Mytilus trossulus]|uniref:collagen alpha-6(VI) chain-like n=1 Tax=Mytilus trossulus TaxID=6551 RepID=UPI003007A526